MAQPREPLADEFEMGPNGEIRDGNTGEIYGRVPIALRDLYNAAPDLLRQLKRLLAETDNGTQACGDKVVFDAKAAIAKAEGK